MTPTPDSAKLAKIARDICEKHCQNLGKGIAAGLLGEGDKVHDGPTLHEMIMDALRTLAREKDERIAKSDTEHQDTLRVMKNLMDKSSEYVKEVEEEIKRLSKLADECEPVTEKGQPLATHKEKIAALEALLAQRDAEIKALKKACDQAHQNTVDRDKEIERLTKKLKDCTDTHVDCGEYRALKARLAKTERVVDAARKKARRGLDYYNLIDAALADLDGGAG